MCRWVKTITNLLDKVQGVLIMQVEVGDAVPKGVTMELQ